jgi:ubiquinone/menaquinone biosynthesis C-methylase UbiE
MGGQSAYPKLSYITLGMTQLTGGEIPMEKNKYERRSVRSYQKKADHYDDTFDGRFTREFKEQLLRIVQIPAGSRVLDIACGNGRLLEMLSGKHDFAGYGVDLSGRMVENARRLNPSMTFTRAGCDALPFQDGFFEVMTVCAAYHHFPDVTAFAKEAFRVLKPGGALHIAEVYYPALIRALCNPLIRFSPAGDVRFYGPDEIIQVLEDVGFRRDALLKFGHIQIVSVRRPEVQKAK